LTFRDLLIQKNAFAKKKINGIPLDDGAPIIGGAIKFKQNAPRYLLDLKARFGSLFRINLFGFKVFVVAGPEFLTSFHMAKGAQI
jgi:hypothetical protein